MKRLMISTLMAALVPGAACMAQGIFDVNKDANNVSVQPAHGFTFVLRGTPEILGHFDGFTTRWHFHKFEKSTVGDTTVLHWSDPRNPLDASAPVPHGEWVHVGYRFRLPPGDLEASWPNNLDTYWTDENGAALPDGHLAQVTQIPDIKRVGPRTLSPSLIIKNALRSGLTATIEVSGYRLWDGQLSLDALNRDNPNLTSGLTSIPGAEGVITLAPGQSRTFRAETPMSELVPGKDLPSVLVVKTQKDVFVDYVQFYPGTVVPPWPPVPAVSHGGLIVMVMLVLAIGAIVVARHPHHTTA